MHFRTLLLAGLSSLILGACASSGYEDPSRDPMVVDALGIGEEDMSNRPSILDGLFTRMRDEPDSVDDERLAELEAAVQRLERERAETRTRYEGMRHGVGLLVEAPDPARVEEAFQRAAEHRPALLFDTAATRQAMADAGCDTDALTECADALAIYPGLRLLIEIRVGADGQAHWRSTDTVLGWQGREQEIRLPMADGEIPAIALESLADRALRSALGRTDAAPWQARVFSNDDTLAINAGRAHGLSTGDILTVTTSGRVLRGPAGQPAGWLPGEPAGRVQVDSLAGDRVATIRLLDGERPTPAHILIRE